MAICVGRSRVFDVVDGFVARFPSPAEANHECNFIYESGLIGGHSCNGVVNEVPFPVEEMVPLVGGEFWWHLRVPFRFSSGVRKSGFPYPPALPLGEGSAGSGRDLVQGKVTSRIGCRMPGIKVDESRPACRSNQ